MTTTIQVPIDDDALDWDVTVADECRTDLLLSESGTRDYAERRLLSHHHLHATDYRCANCQHNHARRGTSTATSVTGGARSPAIGPNPPF